jgi:integral membrane sensor domain MASE1
MLQQVVNYARQLARLMGLPARKSWQSDLLLCIAYVLLYVIFEAWSSVNALHGLGISAWSPSAGITVALLIIKGPRWFPIVAAAELISASLLSPALSQPLVIVVGAALVAGCYAATVAFLRSIGFDAALRRTFDLVALLVTATVSSGLAAFGLATTYSAAKLLPWSSFAEAAFHNWIGDAVGIIILVPSLLTGMRPPRTLHRLTLVDVG